MPVLRLLMRGWLIVTLTAVNVGQVAGQHYLGAALCGFLISLTWWTNARSSSRSDHVRCAGPVYACGASLGTVTGMWIVRFLYG